MLASTPARVTLTISVPEPMFHPDIVISVQVNAGALAGETLKMIPALPYADVWTLVTALLEYVIVSR
jgi:hypothetical protein